MPGPSDISVILSQAGRIEKATQSPFAQSEVTKQILTEEEARERLRLSREVSAAKKSQEIAVNQREHEKKRQDKKGKAKGKDDKSKKEKKHIIDLVI
ncbi:MAG: hypothetical protein J7L53_08890 [Deltaproteobacteria bacterium]|nr:hypothetical protein [Deltaproteobacteria bacterium]